MTKDAQHDYNKELDILHVYISDIDNGIRGSLNYGNFNIDIGQDDKIVGIEIEGASDILNVSPEILSDLDNATLIIRKKGNNLFMGVGVIKGEKESTIQIIPTDQITTPLTIPN